MIVHHNNVPQSPDRVVLLGASGFIGMAIRALLDAQGVSVIAPGSREMDLTDSACSDKLAGMIRPTDSVIMLAAITPDKGRDVASLMKNLRMMENVCNALRQSACAHLLYFSSDAVYDTAISRVTEDTPASPQDLYGAMHQTREVMARSLAPIPLLIIRPSIVYGLADTHNSYGPNRFRRAAQKDRKITLFGGGEETRDHIHIDDVAAITVRCLMRRTTGVLNAATGRSTTFSAIAKLVADQFTGAIEIATTARANPITHRHYDISNLIKAFPDLHFVAVEDGIAGVHRQSVERV